MLMPATTDVGRPVALAAEAAARPVGSGDGCSVGKRVGHAMGAGVQVQLGSGEGGGTEGEGAAVGAELLRYSTGDTKQATELTKTALLVVVGREVRRMVGRSGGSATLGANDGATVGCHTAGGVP